MLPKYHGMAIHATCPHYGFVDKSLVHFILMCPCFVRSRPEMLVIYNYLYFGMIGRVGYSLSLGQATHEEVHPIGTYVYKLRDQKSRNAMLFENKKFLPIRIIKCTRNLAFQG